MKNKTLNRIYNISKPHIKTIIVVSLFAIIIDLIEIFKPYLVKIIINEFLSKGIYEKEFFSINIIGIVYLMIVIAENVLDYITTMKTNIMGEEILYTLRNKLYHFSQMANISFHDKTPAGKLFVRITNDVEDISAFFKDVITTFFKDIISIITVISIMIYLSFKLSILTFLIIPFIIITSIILTKILNKIYDDSKIVKTKINTFLAESIYASKLIKIFNLQQEKTEECEKLTNEYFKTRFPSAIYEGMFPGLMTMFENLSITIIICSSLNNWLGIGVDVGIIYIFVSYIKSLFTPINRIIDNIEIVQEAIVSINKIYDILDHEEVLENFKGGEELNKKIKGKIEFKNVWFAYENENWVLKNISFIIEPGETIALVGKTGSGKTTITNLVTRFYDIQKGEILLDGVNIKEINLRELRRHIGIILQDPFIFARTIEDNIRLNKKISEEEIKQAIIYASANEFVNNLPLGLKEIAKERGESFSAGEKQLLAFARIFAHNPDIFVLDEATANIDTYTEDLIQKSINTLSAQKTAIFIAHRLSTIVNVDKIIVLNNGEIIEQGNHRELLKNNGYYAKLYNSYYDSLA